MQPVAAQPVPWSASASASASALAPAAAGTGLSAAQVDGVARQFEQLLVRQLLSQARHADLGAEDDAQRPSAGYLQLADDHLAATVAAVGGLGLASSVRRWLQGQQAYRATTPSAPD